MGHKSVSSENAMLQTERWYLHDPPGNRMNENETQEDTTSRHKEKYVRLFERRCVRI